MIFYLIISANLTVETCNTVKVTIFVYIFLISINSLVMSFYLFTHAPFLKTISLQVVNHRNGPNLTRYTI